jgi:hypothetical protein
VIAAAAAALAWGGPDALVPLKDAAAATSQVSVAFIVDFGGSDKVDVGCVKVPSTDNGYAALLAFTQQEDVAPPTYANSGLLCSIGGIPSSGCGQVDGDGYIYWSYWHGDSGAWSYSQSGAGGTVHPCNAQGTDCQVEGWRFQDPGKGNPSDPPPEAAPDYADICEAGPPPTTTTTTSTVPTSPTTTVATTTPAGGGSDAPTPPAPHPASTGTTPHTGTAGGPSTTTPAAASTTSRGLSTPSHGSAQPATKAAAATAGQTHTLPDSAAAPSLSLPHVNIQAIGGTTAVAHGGNSGGAAPLWIGGALVILLVAAGIVIARRRAQTG